MEIQDETAWAAVATQGSPRPFLHGGSVKMRREDVLRRIGGSWSKEGDASWRNGWRRAYRAGWRVVKVRVSVLS